jgi:membrane protein
MTHGVDLLGPVDWIVVEFPGSRFNGEIGPALADLVDRGIVGVLDLVMVCKDDEGSVEAHEIADLDDSEVGQLRSYEARVAMLLSENDVTAIAEAVEPGSSAAVLVWENCWATPFAAAVRHCGGQLVASGQIPIQALLAALDEDSHKENGAADMPLAARRVRKAGLVGPVPVARTATAVAEAAVVTHGVGRRTDRRDDRRNDRPDGGSEPNRTHDQVQPREGRAMAREASQRVPPSLPHHRRPPVPRPSTSSSSPPWSGADPPERLLRADSAVPGSRALAWAVVGLAALRRRSHHAATRRARTDPYRSRPAPDGAAPSSPAARDGAAPAHATSPEPADGTAGRPGGQAETPTPIPPRSWWQVTRRAFKESSADNLSILAGGITYFGFIAIFPALIAGTSLYGLVADPTTIIPQQGEGLLSVLPQEAQTLIRDQLNAIASSSGGTLSISLVVSILAALWSASSGTGHLMAAVNAAYDEQETRGTGKRRATALLLTLGAIVFVLLALALVAVIPAVLNALQLGTSVNMILQVVRWVLLVALVLVALAVVYRVAPDRDAPQFEWTSIGALVATVLWVLGSIAFNLYVTNFGSYNTTYGTLAGVVVLLLWLYLTNYVFLLGAEINAEAEKQTLRDTTTGEPLGAQTHRR